MSQFCLADRIVAPLIVPQFLPLSVVAVAFSCMNRATELPYLISGNNQFGRVNLSRVAAGAAVKKAKELLQEGYLDVRISTPRGRILLSDEFDQLEG
ncbi:hypothetical protein [Bradyrhizobium sp. SRL28]|uniref:hypothetical protein n=1 Tax=Bradyrhizobium sp. SRL28 TaxID=2836178 RepID=UPI00201C6D7C|nr:hypothetical protein [Bradyrhizobium sp. SRL28]